jgi:hypothetical protein
MFFNSERSSLTTDCNPIMNLPCFIYTSHFYYIDYSDFYGYIMYRIDSLMGAKTFNVTQV